MVLWGGGDDRGYGDVGTFRQGPGFFYLTGVELPNAVLVLRPHEGYEALFLPARNEGVERWTGPKWGPGEDAAAALGFDRVLATEAAEAVVQARRRPVPGFEGRLRGWLGEPDALLWTPLPALPVGAELPPTHRLVAALRDRLPTFAVRDVTEHVGRLRQVKEPGEVELMRRAIAITAEGIRRAASTLRPGLSEGAVDGMVYAAFRAQGAEGVAFPSIVGSGFNATTLHYDQNAGVLRRGGAGGGGRRRSLRLLLRRPDPDLPVTGRFTDRQRALYEVVLNAHDLVAAAIRPGVTLADLRRVAFEAIDGSPLRGRATAGRSASTSSTASGTSSGSRPTTRAATSVPLEPGMVITNEPGIYIPGRALGVRIEDDYLVTGEGAENLSAGLPTRPEEIEGIMRRR